METKGRSAKPPGIFINTSLAQSDPSPSGLSPNAALPTFKLPNDGVPPLSPNFPRKASTRSKESRKLLGHLLRQLATRPKPPTVYEMFGTNLAPGDTKKFTAFVKQAVKISKSSSMSLDDGYDDNDEEDEGAFSTDATFDLMSQLSDVLMISVLQGWQLFNGYEETTAPRRNSGKSPSPFRRSLHPSGRRSRSPSPARAGGGGTQTMEILSECIAVLSSVVSEDCRFKISPPRPSRPPNALQALTLKVAQFLVHLHRDSPKTIAEIAYAILPAFNTFPPEMHARLLAFYEESIIRGILESLREIQGASQDVDIPTPGDFGQAESGGAPMFSIRVEGADDDDSKTTATPQWTAWVDAVSTKVVSILSTNAPLQGSAVYFLASIVPPLFSTILDNIDFGIGTQSSIDVLHRFHRLCDLAFTAKVDAYLDIFEVLAYHTPATRHSAAALLASFFPKAVGHILVTRPLKTSAYLANSPAMRYIVHDHPHAHQFVPWQFTSSRRTPVHECRACSKTLNGFGLHCPFCTCSVHLDCYDVPIGCYMAKYSLTSDASMQKVALFRFADVCAERQDRGPHVLKANGHVFRAINIFALSLCAGCREPLWGPYLQGYRCLSCMQFVHERCINAEQLHSCRAFEYDSGHIFIDGTALQRSCVGHYAELLSLSRESLAEHTYEEISMIRSFLWIQVQVLLNGIALGSVVTTRKGKPHDFPEFELHYILRLCSELIDADALPCSEALEDFLQSSKIPKKTHVVAFDWPTLMYVATNVKSPITGRSVAADSSHMLSVQLPDSTDPSQDAIPHPFEQTSTSHIRNALGVEFNLHSDAVAKLTMSHLHHLGFFQRSDGLPHLADIGTGNAVACSFPLPLGLDYSTDVETLFAAVEACLDDIDLTVNEVGFLLLTRRLPPNGMASEYAMIRLARAVASWIFAEDDNLAVILREYVAKQRILPGVQSSRDIAWPQTQRSRAMPQGSTNNGGDYIATRRALLVQYALPWLQTLHNASPEDYAKMLFDICLDMVQESSTEVLDVINPTGRMSLAPEKVPGKHLDPLLRLLGRLSQHSATFVVLDDMFNRWLDSVAMVPAFVGPVPSLLRLFPRDTDGSYRASTMDLNQGPGADINAIDPWRKVITSATESKDGLVRSLHWLLVFARSGVEISLPTWNHFVSAMNKIGLNIQETLWFVRAVVAAVWIRPTSRVEMQKVLASLHTRHIEQVISDIHQDYVLDFIRMSLGICLVLYGCNREKLVQHNLVAKEDIDGLPSRRKLHARGSLVSDPIIVPPELMKVLTAYLDTDQDDIVCVVARFLHTFITSSPFVEPYEVDNFILRNGVALSQCAWQLYGIQRDEVADLRAPFLLRVIVVDDQPFRLTLKKCFRKGGDWGQRLEGVARLFRIILDSSSPSFNLDDRLWRSNVIDVFEYFFTSLWADEKEEIRLSTETLVSTMQQVHFAAITSCWNEVLMKSPIGERTRLVSFLIQLRSHFPLWKVVSWEVIIEALLEDEYDDKDEKDAPATAYLSMYTDEKGDSEGDPNATYSDASVLRVSLILLSLNMLASGVESNYNDIMRIKHHLVLLLGFSKVEVKPHLNNQTFDVLFGEARSIPALATPCINELVVILDAPHSVDPYNYTGVREDASTPLLVGGPFVDVAIKLFCSLEVLETLPVLTLKSLLEVLGVIIQKQDVERKVHLKHMAQNLRAAVLRAMDLLCLDINYECRQLAMSVVQSFTKTWTGPGLRSFVSLSLEHVAKMIASLSYSTSQDTLVAHGKQYIESTLTTYATNGTLVGLFRRPLDREVFLVLKQVLDGLTKTSAPGPSLKELLLRDTLPRAAETDQGVFAIVLTNIQTFVEVVYHQGYSADLMSFAGQQLTQLARRSAETQKITPTPILAVATILIQHNKLLSRDLLTYTDAVLRITLNRLEAETEGLTKLIQVTSTLYRRTQTIDSTAPTNAILAVIFELLGDGLRMKARIHPMTIKAMLEALSSDSAPILQYPQEYPMLPDNGFFFLLHHNWSDGASDNDFTASMAVAKFVLHAAHRDPSTMSRLIEATVVERRHSGAVRAWNMLLLAALTDPEERWVNLLYLQLPTFSMLHQHALRANFHGGGAPDSAIADINYAYASIKLWLLIAQKRSAREGDHPTTALMVWNELWPPFEGVVNMFETEVQAGLSVTLALLTWSTVADLFIFVRALRSPVTIHSMNHLALLNRLSLMVKSETRMSKISRALRALSETVAAVPMEALISQTAQDIIAAEKLRVLEAGRVAGRGASRS
ncbi:hypothetical protein CYLTODRAFT_367962 [Cylindrobasidium torrendii FP15055 ss-10]|uniref:Phorbol-ester/DAG-type domain-containing protein n=1 Tax=Cylindrobasidium torrendii FP15055 ss-10 TaxID=1314674 RepID=A0A0D7BNV4_9AGAR|nr:hypothetical protein CYLTODRAFT_367962 [Cylindrobasidium torrendii FP15055 ss-10]